MASIKIFNLSKKFKKFEALTNINLELSKGKIIGLLGRNGAGKSTLLNCIMNLYNYDGEIFINDILGKSLNKKINEKIAFIPDVSNLDDRLTVKQTLTFISKVHSCWNELKASSLMEISQLPLNKPVSKLSKGMRTKLYLIMILSLDVDILILDEPTIGLDITFRKEFFDMILGNYFTEEKTILISTHQIEEIEHILDEIIIIDKGKIVLHENKEELKSRYKIATLPSNKTGELLELHPLYTSKGFGEINGLLESHKEIEGATYKKPSISDLFIAKTGGNNENH